jgi:hypothetical protein
MIFTPLHVPLGVAARDGGCPHRHLNVLAFIQTEAAPVLFQIHLPSCVSSLVRQKRVAVENKILGQTVLTNEASLIGGSL